MTWFIGFWILATILLIIICCAMQASDSYRNGYIEGYKDAKGGLRSDYEYLSRADYV